MRDNKETMLLAEIRELLKEILILLREVKKGAVQK